MFTSRMQISSSFSFVLKQHFNRHYIIFITDPCDSRSVKMKCITGEMQAYISLYLTHINVYYGLKCKAM